MTSGGDTDKDLIDACKPSAKNHEEKLYTVLRTKPLKNHRLRNPSSGPARGHISLVCNSLPCLRFHFPVAFRASPTDRKHKKTELLARFCQIDLLGYPFGPQFDLPESFLACIFLQCG